MGLGCSKTRPLFSGLLQQYTELDWNRNIEIATKLKHKLSSGHNEISSKLPKDTIVYIKYSLTYIIIKPLPPGTFNIQLKIAKVNPILSFWSYWT